MEIDQASIIAWLQAHTGELSNALKAWFPVLMKQGGNIVSSIGNLLLLPLLLYYFLLDWQRWSCGIAKLVPRRFAGAYTRITGNLNEVLGEFLRGQLLVMLIMGLVYGLGLMLVGLDSGFAIGMVAGILVFVPIWVRLRDCCLPLLQPCSSSVRGTESWLFGRFLPSVSFSKVFSLRRNCRRPYRPVAVLGYLFADGVRRADGFVGMLAGLPLAAVTLVLLREGAQKYFAGSFYRGR
ncbi:Transporter, putative [Neisseria gonorrhoeae]|uniref:Transporter, putative n=1 Tax=Neisseria gonorrhoeae TaxID=485 RepID=A0A378VWC8_NEIGO|nr:Transporter, putative [Neisseria gonorrhoeae]